MWHEVLPRLAASFRLQRGGPSRFDRRRPRAWLTDGHNGPLPVRAPQVIQLHEAPWTEPDTLATLEPEFLERVVGPSRAASAAAAAIVCPSESSKRQIVADAAVSADRVFVALHGVDHRVFHPGVPGADRVAAAAGADPDRPYILTVASVHPRKNLMALRGAVSLLADDGYPHQLVLVEGPAHGRSDGAALRDATAADLPDAPGRVVTLPHGVSDEHVAALMCGAAAFCLPSLSEGFGLPAAEAMACGAPTVLSNRGALPEVSGGAAVLVEPTAAGVAQGLAEVLGNPERAKEIGGACALRARDFTWDRCTAGWTTAIHAGIDRGAP
jgi:glycosyltransferase involved in cell wall biosynthesis